MHYTYKTKGTCSQAIEFDYNDGIVTNVRFIGGCRGNTVGVARLAEGMQAEEIIARCEGIPCRGNTSCPDQFAKALREASKSEMAKCEKVDEYSGNEPDCANCPNPCK